MNFIPFGESLEGVPHIMVDGGRSPDTILELSHWPGNRTPAPYKADTSTESVLKFLMSNEKEEIFTRTNVVSNDHYDIDGLLSVWSVLNPIRALEASDLLVETAVNGDFDKYVSERSLEACLALTVCERELGRVAESKTTEQVTGFLYERMLPKVHDCLHRPSKFKQLWCSDYDHFRASWEALKSDNVHISTFPEVDLAVVESNLPLHDFAVYAATDHLRVLTVVGGTIYVFRYRYESFVEFFSRKASPRIRLDSFTDFLNSIEKNEGRWFAESVATAHPRLQFYTRHEVPGGSSIPHHRFVDTLRNHLLRGSNDTKLQWRNDMEWYDEPDIPLPPSLDKK